MEPCSGAAVAGNRMRKLWCWGDRVRVGHRHVEDDTSVVYGCPFQGTLHECTSNQMYIKEIWIMEIHSFHSH